MKSKRNRILAILLGAGFLGGCAIFTFLGVSEPARPFVHAIHVEQAGMSCEDCHAGAAAGETAGMPEMELCLSCHEELDPKQPEEKRLATLYGEKPVWSDFARLPGETIFSHKEHLDAKMSCAECHGEMGKNQSVTPAVRVDKDDCMTCHATKGMGADCAACHETIRKDVPPPGHDFDWKRQHGWVARADAVPPYENRCTLCHEEASCVTCHQDEAPANHTPFWRIKQHGTAATVDRSGCATCHETQSCDRCHQETAPSNHTAAWASPSNRHCNSCHFPLGGQENCTVCHATAPHPIGAPQPATHVPGADCRQCHGQGLAEPLPHPDKGDDCNACHQ